MASSAILIDWMIAFDRTPDTITVIHKYRLVSINTEVDSLKGEIDEQAKKN